MRRRDLLATLPLAALAACGGNAAPTVTPAAGTGFPRTVTDAAGAAVTIRQRPERIVSLGFGTPDILYDLGIAPVAMNSVNWAKPVWGAQAFTEIPYTTDGPDVESVARAKPDLIINSNTGSRAALEVVAPVFVASEGGGVAGGPIGVQGALDDLARVGQATGREAQATVAAQRFRDRLAAYVARSPHNLTALVLFPQASNIFIFTDDSITGDVLTQVTRYPWKPPAGSAAAYGQTPYSIERVLAVDPDVIFAQDYNDNDPANAPQRMQWRQAMEASPFWKELKAVKTGRVYAASPNLIRAFSTHRVLQMLDAVMPKLYPQVFPQPLP